MRSSCEHPAGSRFWDGDESKCRVCGDSVTFPRRVPTAQDARDRRRDARITAGEHRRRDESPVVEVQEVEASPSAPLLLCHCCKELLPANDFYRNNSQTARNRGYRASRCRGCTSFQLRVRRELNPEGTRQRDRARRERYIGALTPILRELEKQRRDTTRNASAVKRYQARRAGTPVMVQKAGRLPIHIKPICRVAATCPLRTFCTGRKQRVGE